MDKQSGKDFKRPAYQRLLKKLRPGDLLIVKSIDRLGRNYDEILEQWRVITKVRQAEGIAAAKARGVRFGMALGAVYRKLRQKGIQIQDKRKKGKPRDVFPRFALGL